MMPYYGMPVGTEYEEVGFGFNKTIITGLLRDELGFDGIICTDWGLIVDHPDAAEIGVARAWGVEHLSVPDRVLKGINAGVDQFGGEECVDVLVAGSATVASASPGFRRGRLPPPTRVIPARALRRSLRRRGRCRSHHRARRLPGRGTAGAERRADATHQSDRAPRAGPTLPLRRGIKVYAEGISAEVLSAYATPVADPAASDVAVLRVQAPYEPGGQGFAAFFHQGSLQFDGDRLDHLIGICATAPTVIDTYLDRPAVMTELVDRAAALIGNFGVTEEALLSVLFGDSAPRGRLPFDLPRSDGAVVVASHSDVPFDTEDPVFRFGRGLRYETS